MSDLKTLRQRANALVTRLTLAKEKVREEKETLRNATAEVVTLSEAQKILQEIAQTVQQQAHKRISSVVTRCLEAIFDDPYTFRIDFERKRGKTEAVLVFERRGLVLKEDLMDQVSGGTLDVAAFALRLACLMLTTPARRRLIILDEPFKFLSPPSRRERAKELVLSLAREMGVQFVIVTNIEGLEFGKVVRL